MTSKKIILSGIQPSGELMIGNYLGSIKQWLPLQDEYECFFPLVDMHAITIRQDNNLLLQRTLNFVALYLAAGIDPNKSTIFIQSQVSAHAELAWILGCNTYMGEINRMTQFKDKSKKRNQNINAGLLTYPILMAADILLYQANLVPVGEDQKQHLELCREIATRLNQHYDKNLFTIPEAFIPPKTMGGRIMSLQEPTKKMSKSDTNENNFIKILDSEKVILKKIKLAVTDSGADIIYDLKNKPGISNLLTLYAVLSNKTILQVEKEFTDKQYGHLKIDLAEVIIEYLKPIQREYTRIREDKSYLSKILHQGKQKATELANRTLKNVQATIGFETNFLL